MLHAKHSILAYITLNCICGFSCQPKALMWGYCAQNLIKGSHTLKNAKSIEQPLTFIFPFFVLFFNSLYLSLECHPICHGPPSHAAQIHIHTLAINLVYLSTHACNACRFWSIPCSYLEKAPFLRNSAFFNIKKRVTRNIIYWNLVNPFGNKCAPTLRVKTGQVKSNFTFNRLSLSCNF